MGAGLVETGDVDEVIVGAELAVGAAGDGRTGGCCRAGSRCGPVGGRLPRVLQGAGLLVGVHVLAGERRAVHRLQLGGNVVEGLQAVHGEVRAHHEQAAARLGGLGQAHEGGPGEGRQPRAALVEAALVADGPRPAVEAQLAGHGQTRGPGLQLVGIPRLDVLQRNGVEREQKAISRLFGKTRIADRSGHGPDVGGVFAIAVDEAHVALESRAAHRFFHPVAHRAGSGEGRLRVHGQHHQLRAAGLLQLLHDALDLRFPIAHARAHHDGQAPIGVVLVQPPFQGGRDGDER